MQVWYDDRFDPYAMRDLIMDEMKAYRKDPKSFIRSQIGIR
jgi:hypothetical protein